MARGDLVVAGARVGPGERRFVPLPVSRLLAGSALTVPLHVLHGARPGPTLALVATLHGDEPLPLAALRELLGGLRPPALRGTLLVVPVANPLALASFHRFTPDQHGLVDLDIVFPGSPGGTLTQQIAWAISQNVIARADHLIEYHSGGTGGRIQLRVDCDPTPGGRLGEKIRAMGRAFGCGVIQEIPEPEGSASWDAIRRGIAAFHAEVGGSYLPREMERAFRKVLVRGTRNILRFLGMLPGKPAIPKRQFAFSSRARVEANPKNGGYLVSHLDNFNSLGKQVRKGELLGELFDPHSLEPLEELRSPADGVLFFSRLSGPVEAGQKGFGIGALEGGRWVR